MLGITSERFPRTGALGLAIIGGTGSFATAISGPIMGMISDRYGVTQANPELAGQVLAVWALLPLGLFVIFGAIYLMDRARAGIGSSRFSAAGMSGVHGCTVLARCTQAAPATALGTAPARFDPTLHAPCTCAPVHPCTCRMLFLRAAWT